jgi:hypothetical protein
MSNLFIPQRAFFSYSFACPFRRNPPPINGNLRDWDESYQIPDLMGVEGLKSHAHLYMAWNDEGLYFGLQVNRKSRYKIDPKNYAEGDCLELFLDTRDVKDTHRANRYCHHFYFLPGGSGKDGKAPIGRQTSIERAREQAPPCPEESIQVAMRRLKKSYQMEIKLPAQGLNGFQPREFNRLGFTYLLHDTELGLQTWSAGRDQPVTQDPATWGTIEFQPEKAS